MTPMRILGALLAVALPAAASERAAAAIQCGTATWYQHGTTTANGEAFNPDGMTAAHRTLPFGTVVVVKNLRNGRTARVRINDRGPFNRHIIDVSRGAARKLGLLASGTARVRISAAGAALKERGCS